MWKRKHNTCESYFAHVRLLMLLATLSHQKNTCGGSHFLQIAQFFGFFSPSNGSQCPVNWEREAAGGKKEFTLKTKPKKSFPAKKGKDSLKTEETPPALKTVQRYFSKTLFYFSALFCRLSWSRFKLSVETPPPSGKYLPPRKSRRLLLLKIEEEMAFSEVFNAKWVAKDKPAKKW